MVRGLFIIAIVLSFTATAFSQRPTDIKRIRVAELTNRAADFLDRKDYGLAEKTLADALKLDPENLTALYDMTCAIAGGGDATRALKILERANHAGFSDVLRVSREPILKTVRELPEYGREFDPPESAVHTAADFHVAQLQKLLGRDYTVIADEPSRLVYAVRERTAKLLDVRKSVEALLSNESELLFHHRPQQFIRVIVASKVDYSRLEARSEVQGSYDDATRTVLVKEAGAELRHEFTHALHAADQHAVGQQHPTWLVEGLGVAFEEGNDTADNWRLAYVQPAILSGALIPLSVLLSQSQAEFVKRSDLAYGEAGSLIVYLHDQKLLTEFYEELTQHPSDTTARRTLERVTGKSLDDLERDWRIWVMRRTAPPRFKR